MAGARGWDDQEPVYGRGAYSDPPADRQPRYRRRRPAPRGSQTYQGEMFLLMVGVVIGVPWLMMGIVVVAIGQVQGLPLLIGGCFAVFIGIWTPHRVTLDDSGVLLQALVRRIRIPWEELESVEPPWWDVRHYYLKWRRSRGRGVVTLQAVPDLHRMLTEIERRSPRTYVSS